MQITGQRAAVWWRRWLEEFCMQPARLRFYRWLYLTGRLTDTYSGGDDCAK